MSGMTPEEDRAETQRPRVSGSTSSSPSPREGSGDRSALGAAHLQFLHDLEASGRLLASGPFVDDADGKSLGSSVSIVRGQSLAEVDTLMREEPFYKAGFRSITVQAWRLADGDMVKLVRVGHSAAARQHRGQAQLAPQKNAWMPVCARPRISACTSCAPS